MHTHCLLSLLRTCPACFTSRSCSRYSARLLPALCTHTHTRLHALTHSFSQHTCPYMCAPAAALLTGRAVLLCAPHRTRFFTHARAASHAPPLPCAYAASRDTHTTATTYTHHHCLFLFNHSQFHTTHTDCTPPPVHTGPLPCTSHLPSLPSAPHYLFASTPHTFICLTHHTHGFDITHHRLPYHTFTTGSCTPACCAPLSLLPCRASCSASSCAAFCYATPLRCSASCSLAACPCSMAISLACAPATPRSHARACLHSLLL